MVVIIILSHFTSSLVNIELLRTLKARMKSHTHNEYRVEKQIKIEKPLLPYIVVTSDLTTNFKNAGKKGLS